MLLPLLLLASSYFSTPYNLGGSISLQSGIGLNQVLSAFTLTNSSIEDFSQTTKSDVDLNHLPSANNTVPDKNNVYDSDNRIGVVFTDSSGQPITQFSTHIGGYKLFPILDGNLTYNDLFTSQYAYHLVFSIQGSKYFYTDNDTNNVIYGSDILFRSRVYSVYTDNGVENPLVSSGLINGLSMSVDNYYAYQGSSPVYSMGHYRLMGFDSLGHDRLYVTQQFSNPLSAPSDSIRYPSNSTLFFGFEWDPDGFNADYKSGYDIGYNDGYGQGIIVGGQQDNSLFTLMSSSFRSLTNILDIEILPNFTLGTLLLIPVGFGIALFVLKLITK